MHSKILLSKLCVPIPALLPMAEQTDPIPAGALASQFELTDVCRRRIVERPDLVMLRWPSQQSIGVASVRAIKLNAEILCVVARFWVKYCHFPKTIPIDLLRAEAVWCLLMYRHIQVPCPFPPMFEIAFSGC